ncbi:MAG: LPS export ABC transporter periplasmic protein LptC [Dysgonamonadaceae bacterium]|jgi:LPS export ABC transporter protein LptC|nr:LPS export ABC transporter periplasmic protein LptC [Dysgonamonadaceae bacterium]
MTKKIISDKPRRRDKATIRTIVALSLLLFVSCSGEQQESVEVAFDPEHTYTMKTTDVSTLVSDSGITRYRANAKEWLMFEKANEPYWYFPEGIYLEQFDTLFQVKASIKADTAYYYEKQELWKGIGNVEMRSLDNEYFTTSLIYWDKKSQKIYSDKYIRIEQQDKVITGIGFESNQSMTEYNIFNTTGIFPINETPADTTQTEKQVEQDI